MIYQDLPQIDVKEADELYFSQIRGLKPTKLCLSCHPALLQDYIISVAELAAESSKIETGDSKKM
jgi:hypothetical protein